MYKMTRSGSTSSIFSTFRYFLLLCWTTSRVDVWLKGTLGWLFTDETLSFAASSAISFVALRVSGRPKNSKAQVKTRGLSVSPCLLPHCSSAYRRKSQVPIEWLSNSNAARARHLRLVRPTGRKEGPNRTCPWLVPFLSIPICRLWFQHPLLGQRRQHLLKAYASQPTCQSTGTRR